MIGPPPIYISPSSVTTRMLGMSRQSLEARIVRAVLRSLTMITCPKSKSMIGLSLLSTFIKLAATPRIFLESTGAFSVSNTKGLAGVITSNGNNDPLFASPPSKSKARSDCEIDSRTRASIYSPMTAAIADSYSSGTIR